jgi:hypothetical protein
MDLKNIKEAQARHVVRGIGYMTESAVEDRALLLAAVPGLLAEIERLKGLARDGWQEAKELANGEDYRAIEDNANRKLLEIGDPS